jgi:hypothetical protein
MGKHVSVVVIVTTFALVFWSKPTAPATHSHAQPALTVSAPDIRASDRLIEKTATQEARAAAAQRLARRDRPNAFAGIG